MKLSPLLVLLLVPLAGPFSVGAEVKIGAHQFTLPDGFEIELIAGPPLVDRPIAAAFDEQGRLYVSDSSGSNDKTDQQLIDRPHRVVRLEDSDGDGRFDKSTVFADKLMFPEGVMWRDGSLYVGAPPSIWKLTDTDGDGLADQRGEWFQGETLGGCANDIHGPYAGPDGFIYWCKGAFAEQTHKLSNGRTITDRASHIFRCRADGSDFESVMTGGMDNPVDVAFTREGEPIFTSTFLDLSGDGKRDGLGHAVYGGVFPKVNDVVEPITRTGELLPAMTHFGPGAPCGFTRVESAALGEDVRDNFFACLFNLHKVTRHILEPAGATFRSRDSDFLVSNNTDFHPTDVIEDADGSLLIIDTGGWYKLCCPTSQLAKPDVLGAIYRMKRKSAPRIDDPRGLKLAWSKMGAPELAALLADERATVVERATAQLGKMGASAVDELSRLLAKGTPPVVRQRALWALARISGDHARRTTRTALNDADPSNRQTAAKIAGIWRDADAQERLTTLLATKESPAHLKRVAAEALGRIGDRRAIPALLAAAAENPSDRFLEHALIFALIEIADTKATTDGLRAATGIPSRRAALIALSEMSEGALPASSVIPLLSSADPVLKETAVWIARRHADWGGELTGYFRQRLEAPALGAGERAEVESLLASMAREPMVQQMTAAILRDGNAAARATLLRAMARTELKTVPEPWIDEVSRILAAGDPSLLRDAVATAGRFVARKEAARLTEPLLAVAREAQNAEALRLTALSSIPAGAIPAEAALFELLRAQLDRAKPAMTRATAAASLARARLDDTQRGAVVELLPQLGPLEFARLLPAFDRALPEALGRRFLAALQNTPALAAGQAQTLRAIFAKLPANLQPEAEMLLTSLNLDTAQQRAKLDALAAELPPGDLRRGQAVFNSAKATCTVCHAVGYLGGKFGPDLTSIGQVRNERDLLEAVVFPSASFVRSFEPMVVQQKGGAALTGIVRSETSDAITLAIGPGAEQRVSRAEIVEMHPGTTSLMPQGFDQILSRQELSDLIAFLKASVRKAH
ncbi:MAG: PVC-type heme-binding CxxCH protein [Chthoniobacteraceae bacterium]